MFVYFDTLLECLTLNKIHCNKDFVLQTEARKGVEG